MKPLPHRYPANPIIRDPEDLGMCELKSEYVHHLPEARVAFANYELLQHDFVYLREEKLVARTPRLLTLEADGRRAAVCSIIDGWLLDNAAFISSAQLGQTLVNSPIPTDGRIALAYRPRGYGRAVVMPIQSVPGDAQAGRDFGSQRDMGLLDLKGAGVAPGVIPSNRGSEDGLEYLGYALRDLLVQWAADTIFARERPTLWTLPLYAVLDLGFDIQDGWHGTATAGMHVRRAHRRRPRVEPTGKGIDEQVRLDLELLLRRHGLSCASMAGSLEISVVDGRVGMRFIGSKPKGGPSPEEIGLGLALSARSRRPLLIEHFDVQLANETSWPPAGAQLVDFGNVRVREDFVRPLCRGERFSIDTIIWPDSTEFVRPDPRVQLPVETWGRRRLISFTFKLADDFHCGRISQRELIRRLEEPLRSWTASWEPCSDVLDA